MGIDWGMFIVVAIGVAIVIGVIRWLVVSRRAARVRVTGNWLPLAWLCVAGVVGLVLIVTLFGPRQDFANPSPQQFQLAIRHAAELPAEVDAAMPAAVVHDGEVWRDVVEEQFETDIYPSTKLAAGSLARQIASHIQFRVLPKDVAPSDIRIVDGLGLDDSNEAVGEIARLLRLEFEVPASVHPEHFQVPAKITSPDEVLVLLSLPRRQTRAGAPWDSGERERSGSIQATIMGQRDRVSVMAQFIEKPWVSRFDEFISQRPATTFLLARTATFTNSEQAAHLAADDRAAESIAQMMMPLIHERPSPVLLRSDLQVRLRNTARWLIHSGHLVKDRFAQKLTRPYGEVWREAVLVELTPAQIESLRNYALEISARSHRESYTFHGGLLGIFAVVVGLYLFLNQATKGYYQARLAAWLSGALILCGLAFALVRQSLPHEETVRGFPVVGPGSSDSARGSHESSTELSPAHSSPPTKTGQKRPVLELTPPPEKPVDGPPPRVQRMPEDTDGIDSTLNSASPPITD